MVDTKKTHDLPLTQEMLYHVRDELKSDITSSSLDARSETAAVRSDLTHEIATTRTELKTEIASVRTDLSAEIDTLRQETRAGFDQVNVKLDKMTAQMEQQNAKFHRMLTIYEELSNQNRYVLDGHTRLKWQS
jgi:hypothetical protein